MTTANLCGQPFLLRVDNTSTSKPLFGTELALYVKSQWLSERLYSDMVGRVGDTTEKLRHVVTFR